MQAHQALRTDGAGRTLYSHSSLRTDSTLRTDSALRPLRSSRALKTRQPSGAHRTFHAGCACLPGLTNRAAHTGIAVDSVHAVRAVVALRADRAWETGTSGHTLRSGRAGSEPAGPAGPRGPRSPGRPRSPVASCFGRGRAVYWCALTSATLRGARSPPGPGLAAPASVTPPIADMDPDREERTQSERAIDFRKCHLRPQPHVRSLLEPQSKKS